MMRYVLGLGFFLITVFVLGAEGSDSVMRAERGYLGFRPNLESLPEGGSGIRVLEIYPDGPAGPAGLREQDLVITLDGEILDYSHVLEMVRDLGRIHAGDTVALEVLRGPKRLRFELQATVSPPEYLERLARWVEKAEAILQATGDVTCCGMDAKILETARDIEGRWRDLLGSLGAGEQLEIFCVKEAETGRLTLNASEPGRVPSSFGIGDLPEELRRLVEGLRPGDSLRLILRSQAESRQTWVEVAELPTYLKQTLR